MLQTSTTDSEINFFRHEELGSNPLSALNADDQAFYNSIKDELDKLSQDPPQHTIDNILKHSKSL